MMYNEPEALPDHWLIELGRVTQSWAALEQLFNLMVQKLAGFDDPFDPTFTVLVAHSSLPQRLDMFSSLCAAHVIIRPHLAKYKEIISQIKYAQSARNRLTHNMIAVDKGDHARGQIVIMSARGKLKQEIQSISFCDLATTSKQIDNATRAVLALVLNLDWASEG